MSSVPGMDSYGIHGWWKQIQQMQSCKAVIGWDGPKKERIRIQVPEMSEVISDGKDSRCQIYIIMSSFKGDVLKILFTFDKNDSIVIELATLEGYGLIHCNHFRGGGGQGGQINRKSGATLKELKLGCLAYANLEFLQLYSLRGQHLFQTQGSKIGHHFKVTFMKTSRNFGHLICFNERFVIFYRLWKFFADLLLAQGEVRWFTMWLAGLSMNIGAQSTRGGFASSFWGGNEA